MTAGDGSPVLEALELLLEPGGVAELRAIGRDGRIASGYFDDPERLAERAEALDDSREYSGVYVTLNPVDPALLARRANRVATRLGKRDATTADADILRRRWLPVDLDPVRPSGVSSTDDEHRAALATGRGGPGLPRRARVARAHRRRQRERRPPPLPGRPPERRALDRAREGRPRRARRPVLGRTP